MAWSITRRIQFCAGHRVRLHESKCRNLHGHNYVALITAVADELDEAGRVIDFSVLKEICGGWVEENLDHGVIRERADKEVAAALALLEDPKVYVMEAPPTAENLADLLLIKFNELLADTEVRVQRVQLWETENCCATAEGRPC